MNITSRLVWVLEHLVIYSKPFFSLLLAVFQDTSDIGNTLSAYPLSYIGGGLKISYKDVSFYFSTYITRLFKDILFYIFNKIVNSWTMWLFPDYYFFFIDQMLAKMLSFIMWKIGNCCFRKFWRHQNNPLLKFYFTFFLRAIAFPEHLSSYLIYLHNKQCMCSTFLCIFCCVLCVLCDFSHFFCREITHNFEWWKQY